MLRRPCPAIATRASRSPSTWSASPTGPPVNALRARCTIPFTFSVPGRQGSAVARQNVIRSRSNGTPRASAAIPLTPPRPTITSPRPYRTPTSGPNRLHRNQPPTTAPAQLHTEQKRQQPHSASTTPDPKRRRQRSTRSPRGRRNWNANHNNPTDATVAPAARSGGQLPAAPRQLDMSATSALPRNPPVPDHTAADRDYAPPTTRGHQNAGKRRHEPDQDVDRPTRRRLQRKLQHKKDRSTDSML